MSGGFDVPGSGRPTLSAWLTDEEITAAIQPEIEPGTWQRAFRWPGPGRTLDARGDQRREPICLLLTPMGCYVQMMFDAVVVLAFTAGMVATFNPCGFSLLPAYVSAFVAGDSPADAMEQRIWRAVSAAAVMSVAFVAVFTVVGLVVGTLAEQVRRQLPWITVLVGSVLILAGVAMAIGWKPTVTAPMLNLKRRGGRVSAMAIYGATFAVASLSCTIGPFLAVTGTVLDRSTGVVVGAYVAYALGMGFMILAISLAVAVAHGRSVNRMRRLTAQVSRIGGVLMILAGLYVIWYARWEMAVFDGNPETNSLIDAGESVRSWFVSVIETVGAGPIAALTAMAVGVGIAVARSRLRSGSPNVTPPDGVQEPETLGTSR